VVNLNFGEIHDEYIEALEQNRLEDMDCFRSAFLNRNNNCGNE